jgi:hypothetical protein
MLREGYANSFKVINYLHIQIITPKFAIDQTPTHHIPYQPPIPENTTQSLGTINATPFSASY